MAAAFDRYANDARFACTAVAGANGSAKTPAASAFPAGARAMPRLL